MYAFGDGAIPVSDVGCALGIAVFAFFSGFINTVAYQLAPQLVSFENGAKVANLINMFFHAAVYCGLCISCIVRFSGLVSERG